MENRLNLGNPTEFENATNLYEISIEHPPCQAQESLDFANSTDLY